MSNKDKDPKIKPKIDDSQLNSELNKLASRIQRALTPTIDFKEVIDKLDKLSSRIQRSLTPTINLKGITDKLDKVKEIPLKFDTMMKKIGRGVRIDTISSEPTVPEVPNSPPQKKRNNIIGSIEKVERAITDPPEFSKAFLGEMVKIPAQAVASGIYDGLRKGLSSAVDTIISVDSKMNELKQALAGPVDSEALLKNSINLAKELGTSIDNVLASTTIFARQGFNELDATALTQVTTVIQNISGMNAEEAFNTITSAMRSFHIEAGNSMQIADKINEVNKTAS